MGKSLKWMLAASCGLTMAVLAWGQIKQKPGLWEVTTTMSMAGMPQMGAMPPRTSQVCVTQAMIDKYGAPYSNPQHGDCSVSDVTMKPNGMTAKITCKGAMAADGTVETTWDQVNTTHTTMHLTGNMAMGQANHPIDMTMKADSTYKGADCGSVKPMEMPADK